MRVLLVSHAYVAKPYREKLIALASRPGIDLCLLAPEAWRHPLGDIPFTPTHRDSGYRIRTLPVTFNGRNGRFIFPWRALARILKEEAPHILHIEAMVLGIRAIGSDSGAIPEVIADAGLVFPEGDAKALAACLQRLVENRELRLELGRRGRDRCLTCYTNERIAAETHRIYRSLVAP